MPPVRWKLSAVAILCLLQVVIYTDGQIIRQEEISADGWKPIIGTRNPNYYDDKYENLSTPPPTITVGPSRKPTFLGTPKPGYVIARKIPHQKHHVQPNPYFALPNNDNHGPHIPIGAVVHTRPGQIGLIKQHATSSKPFIIVSPTSKRNVQPIRVQSSTNNYHDVLTASATSGTYNPYKKKTSNIRTRETLDLGLPGANHYSINQPHSHIEFTNRFGIPSPNNNVFQFNNPSIPAFIFAKPPQTNEVNYQFPNQNEELTRNLIPPPQLYKSKESANRVKPKVPENVVLQIPPTFQFQTQKLTEPQVQITKEKVQELSNNVPPTYQQYIQYDFSGIRKPTQAPQSTYEVTEGKDWDEPPSKRPLRTRKPTTQQSKIQPEFEPVFLPTPFKAEKQGVEPTSPTQSEVSTIFTKLSQMQREKEVTTPDPSAYNVKEVSTHYPIFGKPIFNDFHSSQEISNDITTQPEEVVTTTTVEPQRLRPHRRRRPSQRQTTTTSTTELPVENTQKTQEVDSTQSVETEKPVRIRRPNRYRTSTEEATTKINRGRSRYRHRNAENASYEPTRRRRPVRPEMTTENRKLAEQYYEESSQISSFENEEAASERSEEVEELPKQDDGRQYTTEDSQRTRYETIRPFIVLTTSEKVDTTKVGIPENEVDVTSVSYTEDITTTTPVPTTSTPSTNIHRIKTRPFKFDNSNRPRFSVKDYRQKLNQQTSTTTSEPHRSTESPRIRLSGRLRRPSITVKEEESTDPVRSKFTPKDPRHSATTEATNIITEKNIKKENTRLRPFGRYKSTTAATTSTPKVSIKPNLFTRRRPPMLNLRSRIQNKNQKHNTETTTEKITTTESNEVKETTIDYEDEEEEEEATTEIESKENFPTDDNIDVETTTDVSKIDPFFYSQRVSDLTSSSKNDYETFKSVSPMSRRIPSYFTISTEDPVLPIEAFFTNLKDKNQEKEA